MAGSRVQVALLQGYVNAGDPLERLADLFELDREDVRRALHWYEGLKRAA